MEISLLENFVRFRDIKYLFKNFLLKYPIFQLATSRGLRYQIFAIDFKNAFDNFRSIIVLSVYRYTIYGQNLIFHIIFKLVETE